MSRRPTRREILETQNREREELLGLVGKGAVLQALYTAARFNIAELLSTGPQHYEELAAVARMRAPFLYSVLRVLSEEGIFAEDEEGYFRLTPQAILLRADAPGSCRALVLRELNLELDVVRERPLRHAKPGKLACERGFSFSPVQGETYRMRKHDSGTTEAELHAAMDAAYDFPAAGVIVAVGGDGMLLTFILQESLARRGIVVTQPPFVYKARLQLEEEGILERCELREVPAFEHLPTEGDVYLLDRVLRLYDDDKAVLMLENCRRAMSRQGTLLIVESVMPAWSVVSPAAYGSLALGWVRRTESELRALIERSGLQWQRSFQTQSGIDIIEVSRE